VVHGFVAGSYWAEGVPRDVVARSVANSLSLAGLRRFMLATADAHRVYADCGFTPLGDPGQYMEIRHSAGELYGNSR
jgi:hypothetical protein